MDRGYNHRPSIIKDRSQRNSARTIMRKELGEKGDRRSTTSAWFKDGGSNARSNLRLRSEHANRGWNKRR